MSYISEASQLKDELDKLRPISAEQEAKVMQKFRLDWNYHSNHLEGNSLTYGETKMLIMFGTTAGGKPLKDSLEITGHNEAIKLILDVIKQNRPLTENFIRELHSLILKEPYWVDAINAEGNSTKKLIEIGKYKTSPNHVKTRTGEIFYFTNPEETPIKMADLLAWYQKEIIKKELSPIILAAKFHYDFIRIHPFDDGNGRTARLLMNFILMQFGFPPAIIKTDDKENYFYVLRQSDIGKIEPFIDYIAQNVVRSLELMIKGAKGEDIEEPSDLDKKIALLEQEIKSKTNKVKVLKSKEVILNIFDDSVARFYKKFISECKKFDRFYDEERFIFRIGATVFTNKNEALLEARKILGENLNKLQLSYDYIHLKNCGYEDLNFHSLIDFGFDSAVYFLKPAYLHNTLSKSYNEQLNEDEINQIIKAESERHLKTIEERIKKL